MKNGTIETTNSYKYLGFIFTPSGEIVTGLKFFQFQLLFIKQSFTEYSFKNEQHNLKYKNKNV